MSKLEKALLLDCDRRVNSLAVQFNPNTLEYSANLSQETGKGVHGREGNRQNGGPQIQSSPLKDKQGGVLSVKLFFHTYTNELIYTDVRASIGRIQSFLPHPKTSGKTQTPRIAFAWGPLTFYGTLESFHVSYQMFAHDGTPVQAEVSISIRGEDQDVNAERINQSLGPPAVSSFSTDLDSLASTAAWLFG